MYLFFTVLIITIYLILSCLIISGLEPYHGYYDRNPILGFFDFFTWGIQLPIILNIYVIKLLIKLTNKIRLITFDGARKKLHTFVDFVFNGSIFVARSLVDHLKLRMKIGG